MDLYLKLRAGILTSSADETQRLAAELAVTLPENCTLALSGDLGAGKTTFVKGLAQSWGILQPVTSPTYNFFNIYQGTRQLIHFDAYRINSDEEADGLLIDEFLQPPYCLVIEWPEKLSSAWWSDAFRIYLELLPNGEHRITIPSTTPQNTHNA